MALILVVGEDTVAHARLTPITQSQWRAGAIHLEQQIELIIGGIVMLLLAIAWLRRANRKWLATVPLLAAAVAVAWAPLGALGFKSLFSPALFLLPIPGDISSM